MNRFRTSIEKKAHGFTLVETMMTSIISIIVIAFVTSFFLNIIVSKQEYLLREEVNYSMKFTLEQITRHLKQTTSVDTLNSVFATNPGKITVQTSNSSFNPLILESDGTHLRLTRGINGPYELTSSEARITSFIIRYSTPNNSPGTISGQLTLQSTIDPSIQRTETFSVSLRNNT